MPDKSRSLKIDSNLFSLRFPPFPFPFPFFPSPFHTRTHIQYCTSTSFMTSYPAIRAATRHPYPLIYDVDCGVYEHCAHQGLSIWASPAPNMLNV